MLVVSVGPARRRFIEWSNSRGFVLWFLSFWVVVCIGGIAVSYSEATRLRNHGVRTEAVVTYVHDTHSDPYVTVHFTARDGSSVSADVGNWDWSPAPHVGDARTVLYDPSDPSGLVADTRLGPDFFVEWLFGGGAVVAAVVFVLTYTRRIDWAAGARRRYGIG